MWLSTPSGLFSARVAAGSGRPVELEAEMGSQWVELSIVGEAPSSAYGGTTSM